MGATVAAPPPADSFASQAPANARRSPSSLQSSGNASITSGRDVTGTSMTTTTANSTPAGSDCSSSSSSDTDSCDERRSLSWRVLRAVKNSSVFGVLKPSAKVTPGTEEEEEGEEETFDDIGKKTLDDIETGSTSSADTSPITPETQKSAAAEAGAAVVVGSSGALGVDLDDLEAGKQQAGEDRCTQSVSFVGRLLIMYSVALDKRPVLTKSVSSGLIGLLGDLLAQSVEWGLGGGPVPWNGTQALWRSCAVMMDGFFINGPLLHYCYEILEKYMPAEESMFAAVSQVAVDVFVIDPAFGFIFVWSTGLFEGRSVKHQIVHTLVHHYPTMVLWLIVIGLAWAPLQIYLFNKYPVQYRVLMADIIDLVWTCVSSFFCHVR
eukprot:jgi/Undpi1/4448/HiC_scaffold_17.g07802.m1